MRKLFKHNRQCFFSILILISLVIMILPSTAVAFKEQETANSKYAVGDINQDGTVNSLDYAMLKGYLLGMKEFSDIGQRILQADVNGDGCIDSLDFASFKLFLLKGIEFPSNRKINTFITTVEDEPLNLATYSRM
ncbi:dockerin type I repeat-containing protein [Acetivibrio clariflavus]|uniref:Dockerin-like protein n=1 Tax=Acetivibrio clariflavus (strain DSM 19732 / NBRC 101661 / EBR45) TaxID=720554 RepID=G8LZX4_ACECE|nr:dockerin type I repeat-containing protein [Acetivibrio clariflavus]AEV69064.1 dockerin-like protein [Acetivibrio clariflavus DSM 19732]HPU41451.1 dockerin type I repeat-containing protein [Acetivibrio clariflavus]